MQHFFYLFYVCLEAGGGREEGREEEGRRKGGRRHLAAPFTIPTT
jgi:hypothetical protein